MNLRQEDEMSPDVLQRAAKALVEMDTDGLVALYADSFVFEDTSTGDRITSKGDLLGYFKRLFSMPAVNFTEVSFFSDGERGAGKWTWNGRSLKTQQAFSIRGASLFELQGDRIKTEIIFYDPRAVYL
jgi:steroid delta-isomerase-like uncharacterized protein